MDTSKAAAHLGRKGGAAGSKESKRRGDSDHYRAVVAKRWGKAPRRAQLVAEAVAVLCPDCGDAQPCHTGSEMWTREDFKDESPRPCCSCDRPLLISTDPKVQFL